MRRIKIYVILTYHYLAASLFFITVKITETITSSKLAQQGTHENGFSQQNVDQQNSKQKRLCCVFVIGLLILATKQFHVFSSIEI
jgi:hypothetical protein